MKFPKIYFAFLSFACFWMACSGKKEQLVQPLPEDNCTGNTYTYVMDIKPIVDASCAKSSTCHGSGSSNGPGPLTTYDLVKANAGRIADAVSAKRMPLDSTLSSADISKIRCWAANGTLNN